MKVRDLALAGLAAVGLAIWMGDSERRAVNAVSQAEEDRADIGAIVSAATELEESALELRAGMQRSFDPIDRAVMSLRAAPREADTVRRRGVPYGEAADALDRLAGGLAALEPHVEHLKTDVALWRLSSRSFFLASDALTDPNDATGKQLRALQTDLGRFGQGATANAVWRIASESTSLDSDLATMDAQTRLLRPLRLDIERFQDQPTRDVGQRIEGELTTLGAATASFPEGAAANVEALLGNARSILDRRERLERTVRNIAGSSLRVEAATAAMAYERAARQQYGLEWVLGIGLAEAVIAAIGLIAAAIGAAGEPRRGERRIASRE